MHKIGLGVVNGWTGEAVTNNHAVKQDLIWK